MPTNYAKDILKIWFFEKQLLRCLFFLSFGITMYSRTTETGKLMLFHAAWLNRSTNSLLLLSRRSSESTFG